MITRSNLNLLVSCASYECKYKKKEHISANKDHFSAVKFI